MCDLASQGLEPDLPVAVPRGQPIDLGHRGTGFVRVRTGSDSSPPIVLLHGLTATAGINWMHVFDAAESARTLVAPDLRGHGRGPRAERSVSIDDHADDIAALVERLGGSASIVGFSFGGAVAQEMALRRPDLVSSLVLVATASRFRMGPISGRLYGISATLAKAARLLPGGLRTALEERFVATDDADIRRFVLEETRRNDQLQLARSAAALRQFRSTPRLGQITVPTSVVVHTSDRTLHPNVQHRLAADIPGAHLVEVPVGHSGLIWESDRAVPALVEAIEAAEQN